MPHLMPDRSQWICTNCCSWDIEVDDKVNDPPNINEVGLQEAVQHKKFKDVRQRMLNNSEC